MIKRDVNTLEITLFRVNPEERRNVRRPKANWADRVTSNNSILELKDLL
jgi:hypothetical protein